ncbi:OmpA family protein [Vibrio coralliilyticus]|uniref:OmpA family protein n=1 Tax=Vibrio coralliilyticus TaxID=190893 RepID=UPI00156090A8|nr:OmpA family protein [Vibrio coralliilyticus]NRF27952.1 OmpA family protein [Vibrio coralliilyticus]NRF82086.1 OmpA family protein [Vibrio coralliilyticus]
MKLICKVIFLSSCVSLYTYSSEFSNDLYLGVNSGLSLFENACDEKNYSCEDRSYSFGLYAGYDLYHNTSFETGINYLGKISADYQSIGASEKNISNYQAKIWDWNFSLKHKFYNYQDYNIYGRLGFSTWYVDVNGRENVINIERNESKIGISPLLGLGIEYNLNDYLGFGIEYIHTNGVGRSSIGGANNNSFLFNMTIHPFKWDATEDVYDSNVVVNQSLEFEPSWDYNYLFMLNSDKVRAKYYNRLKEVASYLNKHPDVDIIITGYTDDLGAEDYNLKLSKKRAESVKAYLLGLDGSILSERLYTVGKGESDFSVPNESELGRDKNRRVSIEIIK